MVVRRGDAWPIAMKVAQDWGFSVATRQAYRVKGPRCQIRHRVAFEGENVYTQHPSRRTLMDLRGQSCCILFPFVDILEALGSGMLKQVKAVKSDSDPFWGCAPLKKERHSTGVCLNGFFHAHFTPSFALILLVIRTFLFSARAIRTIDVASAGGDSADC